ncbi:MAG TPA: STAS domain-containing protein [Leptospiraceae bacterium]|nr:STAS domain-containing protein [Leptospiraceae bacterium]HMY67809.1 STAS domain-containing protein [Leptospiraceae bacterium]HMZ59880.1 STAS domain-containing protein [Leptospiraceae bacterium]HNH10163.1 STAS domain-containing protein [Leptospiraceae bacterium]HNI96070.1 STAS domain-containing protein [Leptospiraceae bacterium]
MKEYSYENLKIFSKTEIINDARVRILVMEGKINNQNSHIVSADMEMEWDDDVFNAIVDMTKLEYINSMGLAAILSMIEKNSENRGKFLIGGMNHYIEKIIQLVEVSNKVEIFSSLQEAVNYFKTGSAL